MDENIAIEETTPTQQENLDSIANETVEQSETEKTADNGKVEKQQITVPVKYNKKTYELNAEEAATLAQKGMKFDSMRETFDKLNYLSAANGMGVAEFVNKVLQENEDKLAEKVRAISGDDEVLFSKLLALEHGKNQTAFDRVMEGTKKLLEEEQAKENEDIAEQFLELKREVPELIGIDDVPQEVLKTAAEKDICLLDAYLRYKHSENRKIMAADKEQMSAGRNSTGSLASLYSAAENVEDAFIKGVWR